MTRAVLAALAATMKPGQVFTARAMVGGGKLLKIPQPRTTPHH